MKKIVFSDIDDTLSVKGNISSENKNAIKKYIEYGNYFVLVSGRNVTYTTNLSKKLNASPYVICDNGAAIYDMIKNKFIYKELVPYESLKEIYDICILNNVRIILDSKGIRYSNKPREGEIFLKKLNKDFYDDNIITKILISDRDINNTRKIISLIKNINNIKILNKHRRLYDSNYKGDPDIWINVSSNKVNKGLSVKKLIDYLNIDLEDTVRIGDDLNDLPMFLDKGINVAVDNAIPELKEKADYITRSCENNGVALVLDKIIKEELE